LRDKPYDRQLGLSTSCPRFPEELPAIYQKVAQKSQKLLFVTKIAHKLLQKKQKNKKTKKQNKICCSLPIFDLMKKYNKSKIYKNFCATLWCNQRC